MKIKPLPGKYFCEKVDNEEKIGSLYVASNLEKKVPVKMKVLSQGKNRQLPDGETELQSAKKGDLIYIKRYAFKTISINLKEYYIIDNKDILCLV